MALDVVKHFLKEDLWLARMLKFVNSNSLSRFFCSVTLRQGTMLIAIIELTIFSFFLFFLLLGAAHAQDITDMVVDDLRQLEANSKELISVEEPLSFMNNEKKMLKGRNMASFFLILLYTGIVLTSIHLISCLLLLYGALVNSPYFLLPWATTVLFSLASGILFLVVLAYFPIKECKTPTYIFGVAVFGLELFAWLIVFTYYRDLKVSY